MSAEVNQYNTIANKGLDPCESLGRLHLRIADGLLGIESYCRMLVDADDVTDTSAERPVPPGRAFPSLLPKLKAVLLAPARLITTAEARPASLGVQGVLVPE